MNIRFEKNKKNNNKNSNKIKTTHLGLSPIFGGNYVGALSCAQLFVRHIVTSPVIFVVITYDWCRPVVRGGGTVNIYLP